MADEGFHEIHLNGKQLVFMFMATTVVAVVIFLSGVMVGRGVPPRNAVGDRSADAANAVVDPTATEPTATASLPPARQSTSGSNAAPVTTQETLTYAERLEAPTPPRETLKEIDARDVPPAAAPAFASAKARADEAAAPATAASAAAARTAASAPVPGGPAIAEPSGAGWAVQVMAVPAAQRGDAEALARRLAAKGYPSYVVPRGSRFAVRVGKYSNQREAEAISVRLKKEEQFDPWVTR